MPEFARSELYLCDWQGNRLQVLSIPGEWTSFTWQHVLNGRGVYSLELVAETDTKNAFLVDYGVELSRNYGDGWYTEYYGLHLDEDERLTSGDVDEHHWISSGWSAEHLLDQPLLWPLEETIYPDPYGDGEGLEVLARYDQWWMHGPADDIMKQMVEESMGGSAATERQFTNVVVQGATSEGVWRCYEARYPQLLTALQELAGEQSETDFQMVVMSGAGFEFRTYSPYHGTDRREGYSANPTIFALEFGNMLNPRRRVIRREQSTVAIGGWQGGGAERRIEIVTNETALETSPYRRREVFVDLRDLASPDEVTTRLAQELEDRDEILQVEFVPLQTEGCLYQRDWALGDLVTARLWGETYDMRVTEVGGRLSGNEEETIVGTCQLWTREEEIE